MPQAAARFKSILVATPGDPEVFNHVWALRKVHPSVHGFDLRASIREHGIPEAEELLLGRISETGADLCLLTLFGDCFQFPIGFLRELRRRARLVLWPYDDDGYFDVHGKYYAQAADAVVTVDYFSLYAYRKLGIPAVFNVPSFPKERYRPLGSPKDIEVSFVGDCNKNDRRLLLEYLRRNGAPVQAFGQGSENGFLEWDEIPRVYSRSKITLNFTKLDELSWINADEPLLNRVRQNKGRLVEIALTRTFCLCEYTPSLDRIFEPGRELDFFCGEQSLLEKVRYYLARPEERERLAENAYRRALAEYEDVPNIAGLLARLEEALDSTPCPQPPTAYRSPGFRRRQANVLLVAAFSALSRRQFAAAARTLARLRGCGLAACLAGGWEGALRALRIAARRLHVLG